MRELKFRAWLEPRWDEDDDANKMYYDIQNSYDMLCDVRPRDVMDAFSSWLNEEHATVEQYTGLKDKNGKEIYEGDIVNIEYYEKPSDKKRWRKTYLRKDINIVGFEDGYFKFYTEDKDGFSSELAFSNYGEWSDRDTDYKYVAEVIGNIHENPELLGSEE